MACILHVCGERPGRAGEEEGESIMTPSEHLKFSFVAAVLAAAVSVGCGREEQAPAATVATQTPEQQMSMPTTVTGCLRAGDTADTFVLTAAQAGGEQTATYQLTGANAANLREHIGRRVEVSGMLTGGQSVELRSTTDPATPAPAATTGQQPAVSTTTELAVRQLEVREVRPLEGDCTLR